MVGSRLWRGLWSDAQNDDKRGRSQLGLAWRQLVPGGWNAVMRYEYTYENLANAANFDGGAVGVGLPREKRSVDVLSAHFNWQPWSTLTLSPLVAVKTLTDRTADGTTGDRAAANPSSPLEMRSTTYLTQVRVIQDLAHGWDVGGTGSVFGADAAAGNRVGLGGEVGRRIIMNLRAAAGYNIFGFRDRDLHETDYTLRGAYLRLGDKFDEALFQKR